MNEIMTIMVGNENEIGEVESINGFFYTVAFAERVEVIDIREIEYKVPAYNLYALTSECEQEEYKDSDICKMNTDTKDITPEKFEKELKKIDEENKRSSKENY